MRKASVLTFVMSLLGTLLAPISSAEATSNWTLIYETTTSTRSGNNIVYTSGYGRSGTAVTNFSNSGKSWNYIRVRFEASLASTVYYSDVYFDKWSGATLAGLEFPDLTNLKTVQRNITNLVVASNYSGVRTGSFALGRLEWWPYGYSQARGGLSPQGDASTYDWDDSFVVGNGDHGSFQVHNLTDTQTVFAWNMHRTGTQELGMGNATSGSHPDWTTTSGVWTNAGFKIQIYVGDPVIVGTVGQPTFSGSLAKGSVTTLTSTANGPGKVTFYYKKKRIAGCIKRTLVDISSTYTVTCNFKPTTNDSGELYTEFIPSDSTYTAATSSAIKVQILRRSSRR